jgi:hypothetical protein
MSRRPRRIAGTSPSTWRREVACGIDPAGALARALVAMPHRAGEVWSIGVGHAADCPTLHQGAMWACTCELVELVARRAA